MIITTHKYICDGCGKEMTREYHSMISVIEFDDYGIPETSGYDFCEECTKSFSEWKRSRKESKHI